jgi:kynurenine formamidase
VNLTHLGADGEVSAVELEKHAEHVRAGDIVLLWTDWPRKTSVEREEFWSRGPYTGPTGCDWLIARGVKAVGYDYPPDFCVRDTITTPRRRTPKRDEYTTHARFFPAGITVIEYLTNLDQIGAARCRFLALPLRIEGADGSPVRAIAYVD